MGRRRTSVLFAAAECSPFVKVGGLGDVIGSLPQALARIGITASVIIPRYASIPRAFKLRAIRPRVTMDWGRHKYHTALFYASLPNNPVNYYFIDHALFRNRAIYGFRRRKKVEGRHASTISDVDRFALFSEAVVEAVHQFSIPADIIHCHDWETALIPAVIDQLAIKKSYPFIKTVFTIHNIGYQGATQRATLKRLDFKPDEAPYLLEDWTDLDAHQLNLLKLGILSADRITTVSPSFAKEIVTSEFGSGLEAHLMRRWRHLTGILNGIDTAIFDPARDRRIARMYTVRSWKQGKAENKRYLQAKLQLPITNAPLYGMVTRLVEQKGFDILEKALPRFVKKTAQLIILGSGEKVRERQLKKLSKKYPEKISVTLGFDATLAQQIYAASDFFVMPSRFEPCGLGQMIAMRYGTIPIVRATGGLKDTVSHLKTGLVFAAPTPRALSETLKQSLWLYSDKKKWYTMVERCMQQDFSWGASARKYKKLYEQLL